MWNTSSFSTRNKIKIFNTNLKSVLLYGSETWRVTKTTTRMLQTFINKCLIYMLKTKWQDKTTNKEIWRRANQHSIRSDIARRARWHKLHTQLIWPMRVKTLHSSLVVKMCRTRMIHQYVLVHGYTFTIHNIIIGHCRKGTHFDKDYATRNNDRKHEEWFEQVYITIKIL